MPKSYVERIEGIVSQGYKVLNKSVESKDKYKHGEHINQIIDQFKQEPEMIQSPDFIETFSPLMELLCLEIKKINTSTAPLTINLVLLLLSHLKQRFQLFIPQVIPSLIQGFYSFNFQKAEESYLNLAIIVSCFPFREMVHHFYHGLNSEYSLIRFYCINLIELFIFTCNAEDLENFNIYIERSIMIGLKDKDDYVRHVAYYTYHLYTFKCPDRKVDLLSRFNDTFKEQFNDQPYPTLVLPLLHRPIDFRNLAAYFNLDSNKDAFTYASFNRTYPKLVNGADDISTIIKSDYEDKLNCPEGKDIVIKVYKNKFNFVDYQKQFEKIDCNFNPVKWNWHTSIAKIIVGNIQPDHVHSLHYEKRLNDMDGGIRTRTPQSCSSKREEKRKYVDILYDDDGLNSKSVRSSSSKITNQKNINEVQEQPKVKRNKYSSSRVEQLHSIIHQEAKSRCDERKVHSKKFNVNKVCKIVEKQALTRIHPAIYNGILNRKHFEDLKGNFDHNDILPTPNCMLCRQYIYTSPPKFFEETEMQICEAHVQMTYN